MPILKLYLNCRRIESSRLLSSQRLETSSRGLLCLEESRKAFLSGTEEYVSVRYDVDLNETLSRAARASTIDEAKSMSGDVNIQYKSQEHYETLTERLGILREWKVHPFLLLCILLVKNLMLGLVSW